MIFCYRLRYILCLIILILPGLQNINAGGTAENRNNYNSELETTVPALIDELESGRLDASSARKQLDVLRLRYDIAYTDEAGILEAIIDASAERQLSKTEALRHFELLQTGKLKKYRQETFRTQSEEHRRELISLLQECADSEESTGLLRVMDNYYAFIGMKHDSEYSRLEQMIDSYETGVVSADEFGDNLDAVDRELIRERNMRIAEENNQNQTGDNGSGRTASAGADGSSQDGGSASQPQGTGGDPGGKRRDGRN